MLFNQPNCGTACHKLHLKWQMFYQNFDNSDVTFSFTQDNKETLHSIFNCHERNVMQQEMS